MFHITPTPIEIVFNLHGINKTPTKQNVRGWSSIPKRITNGIQSINGSASSTHRSIHPLSRLVLVVILMHWCFCWWSLLAGTESGLWIDEAHRLDLIFINTQTFHGTSLFIATSLRKHPQPLILPHTDLGWTFSSLALSSPMTICVVLVSWFAEKRIYVKWNFFFPLLTMLNTGFGTISSFSLFSQIQPGGHGEWLSRTSGISTALQSFEDDVTQEM